MEHSARDEAEKPLEHLDLVLEVGVLRREGAERRDGGAEHVHRLRARGQRLEDSPYLGESTLLHLINAATLEKQDDSSF